MATMNVSLPDEMKEWVGKQSEGGRYANSSDYVRDLIRRDQDRAAKIAAMQERIDEAYASGFTSKTIEDVMRDAWKAAQS
jgi:antitoxin ParD1/3/4